MADVKVSELAPASTPTGLEYGPFVQNARLKRMVVPSIVLTPQMFGSPGPSFDVLGSDFVDNYPYIIAAIDAAAAQGGGHVYLNHGIWWYGTPISITNNSIVLEGQGNSDANTIFPTTLWFADTSPTEPALRFGGPSIQPFYGGLKNIRLDGGLQVPIVLQIRNAGGLQFENITVVRPANNGCVVDLFGDPGFGPGNNKFYNCVFLGQNPGVTGLGIVRDRISNASRNVFFGCDIFWSNDTATAYGLNLGAADSNLFIECDFLPNFGQTTGYPIFFNQGTGGNSIFPSQNVFVQCFPESADFNRILGGTAGLNGGNIFFGWDDQVTIPSLVNNVIVTSRGVTFVDGKFAAPVLPSYSKSALPFVDNHHGSNVYLWGGPGQMIYVTDDVGGAVPAFSDGANWRRVTDRNIIS